MILFKTRLLSSAAVEVLGQLFVKGPTWDGNLISKAGCSELIEAKLVNKINGFSFLLEEGVRLAAEWNLSELRSYYDQGWYKKASCQ